MDDNCSFTVKYTKTSSKSCIKCKSLILKGNITIATVSQSSKDDTLEYNWYHHKCFMKCKLYTGSVLEKLENFESLRYDDQQELLRMEKISLKRPSVRSICPTPIKIKEEIKDEHDLKEEKTRELLIAKQSKQFFSHRCFLEKYPDSELQSFLTLNGCGVVMGKEKLLDRAADFLTFGVTDKCNQCKTGDFEFKKNGYRCNGDVSEWAMCDNYVEKPQRHELVLPENWKLEWDAWHFKPIIQDRAIRPLVLTFNWTKEAKSMKLDDAVIGELVASPHVDPKSKMETRTHVYKKDSILYSVVLTITDIQRNKNSYYKMQLLEENFNKKYHVFTSWGRIGTQKIGSAIKTILGNSAAIDYFEELYMKKTQNSWDLNRTPEFQKKPGCYVPIDLHDTETEPPINEPIAPSQLPVQLQDLIKMMFDVNSMKQTMKEFMLDLSKVTPGRLKRKQLEEANQCLAGLFMLVENGGRNAEFIGLSNKFYTLIPHAFGTDNIPIIDTIETIREKSDMIESLLEIETAHSMMYAERYSAISPIDFQYAQLMNQLTPLDRNTEEFELIEQYLQNTHGDTHTLYRLEIQEVFKVDRFGESKRYEPWQNMHNRTLLWHGSRLTNFVGILSHGLKIAPPEAPPRSHMFGKGIYFADMVTKSSNYCNPDYPSMLRNTSGLLLLCEVALGNMQHLTKAKTIVSLPQHVHSIMGLGRMIPEPSLAYTRKDGVIIPLGKPKKRLLSDLYPLYYNEFIVYNESQVKIQYLLKVFFRPVAQSK